MSECKHGLRHGCAYCHGHATTAARQQARGIYALTASGEIKPLSKDLGQLDGLFEGWRAFRGLDGVGAARYEIFLSVTGTNVTPMVAKAILSLSEDGAIVLRPLPAPGIEGWAHSEA